MTLLIFTFQTLIGTFFIVMGGLKLSPSGGPDAALFARLGLPHALLKPAGVVNLVGGAGMLLGLALPTVTSPAGALLVAYLGFALAGSLKAGDVWDAARLAVLLVMCMALTLFAS